LLLSKFNVANNVNFHASSFTTKKQGYNHGKEVFLPPLQKKKYILPTKTQFHYWQLQWI